MAFACPKCRTPARPGDAFCGNCGAPLAPAPGPASTGWGWQVVLVATVIGVMTVIGPQRIRDWVKSAWGKVFGQRNGVTYQQEYSLPIPDAAGGRAEPAKPSR